MKRCFEKNPEHRWQSARDLGLEVRALTSEPTASTDVEQEESSVSGRWPLAAAVVVVALVAFGGWWATRTAPVGKSFLHAQVAEAEGQRKCREQDSKARKDTPRRTGIGGPGQGSA